jgi:hypothetical protein
MDVARGEPQRHYGYVNRAPRGYGLFAPRGCVGVADLCGVPMADEYFEDAGAEAWVAGARPLDVAHIVRRSCVGR